MRPYARPLTTSTLLTNFLEEVLEYDYSIDGAKQDKGRIIDLIIRCETGIQYLNKSKNTFDDKEIRDKDNQEEGTRRKLREDIVKELFNLQRLADDDEISLGNGGATPVIKKYERQAIILTGLPASGKSFIANKIADEFGAYILDSDYAKRKLPEFQQEPFGATLVHKESDIIVFGSKSTKERGFKTLLKKCTEQECNIVIPKIGYEEKSVIAMARFLKEKFFYDIHLICVSLDRQKATNRAINRFLKTGRYIPISGIFDGYANDPILTYYRIKKNYPDSFKSFGKISTDNTYGSSLNCLDNINQSPVELIIK